MGFESYLVELRGPARDGAVAAVQRLRTPPAVRTGGFLRDDDYFVVADERGKVEIEITGGRPRIACRFALCNPPSVESILVQVVSALTSDLGWEVSVCGPGVGDRWFSAVEIDAFAAAVRESAAERRAEWVAAFGPEQFPATEEEAYARIILPRCTPVISPISSVTTPSPRPAPLATP